MFHLVQISDCELSSQNTQKILIPDGTVLSVQYYVSSVVWCAGALHTTPSTHPQQQTIANKKTADSDTARSKLILSNNACLPTFRSQKSHFSHFSQRVQFSITWIDLLGASLHPAISHSIWPTEIGQHTAPRLVHDLDLDLSN